MNYKTSRAVQIYGVVLGLALTVIAQAVVSVQELAGIVIGIVGLVAVIIAVGQSFVFYRCPHCNGSLDKRGAKPNFCPHCGEKIPWD